MKMMKKVMWWMALAGLVGVQAFGFLCAALWLKNLFRKLDLFWDAIQENPTDWESIRIGGMEATLYVKNLQVDVAIVTNGLQLAIAATLAVVIFAAITLWWRRKRRTQPPAVV